MEVNISELSDKKTIYDYPDDTIFVWSEAPRPKRDPKTGLILKGNYCVLDDDKKDGDKE